MKKTFIANLAAAAIFATAAIAGASETTAGVSADQALQLLISGNQHFMKGEVEHLEDYAKVSRRLELAAGQKPFAIIVACSDSRVPPELLFDKGLGEIFVVRVAGNIVGEHELGSIEYGAEHLGAKLIMVLGHERCGAVTATYDAVKAGTAGIETEENNIDSLVKAIEPAVTETIAHNPTATVEECIVTNINKVTEQLETHSPLLKEMIELGHVKVVKAKYDLDSGKVQLLP